MRNKQILLSGRAVVTNAANVPADRYTFLHLSDAEPNLGTANANGWVLVYDTETPGNRLWSKNLITAYDHANSAYQSQNTTGVYANAAFIHANAGNLQANSAYESQNVTGTYANNAYVHANSAYESQNTTGSYANAAFLKANSAYESQNVTGTYANNAYLHANSAYESQNTTGSYANAAFLKANSAYASQNVTGTYANNAYTHANAAYAQANSASLYANGAFTEANSAYASQNVTGTYANNAYAQANAGTALAQNAYDNSNTKYNITGGTIAGNVTIANNLTVLGNVNFIGNVTSLQVTGNSGQFFGDAANGFNALYAGIPVGYDFQPQTVFQTSANYNGYAQINIQNINPGGDASGDYVVTADNGTENDTYVNLGIGSSTHSDPDFTLVGPNDAYLYAHGNTSTSGGDLVIGTFLEHDVVFAVGGMNVENEQMRILGSSNTIAIRANVDTTNSKSITLGPIANVHIAGGSNDDYIRTDGLGNLTFASLTSANVIKVLYTTTNASFVQANSAYESQNTTGVYANAAFLKSNSAYDSQNVTGTYANNAYLHANSAYESQNTTGNYANASFLKANSAYESQNTTGVYANAAFLKTNSAYQHANSSYDSQNVTGTYANSAYTNANAAFLKANSAYESQNVTGTYANNAYLHANSSYESQNTTGVYANAAFIKANAAVFSITTNVNELYSNTSSGNIQLGLANVNTNIGTWGGNEAIPVINVDGHGRILSVSNTTISVPPGTYIFPNTGQITTNANFGNVLIGLANVNSNIGTFGSEFAVPTITTDGYGRIVSISNTTISIPQGTYIVNSNLITSNSTTGNVVLGLAESGVTPGTYGGPGVTPVVTVDLYGRVTVASNVASAINALSTIVRASYTATAAQTIFNTTSSFTADYLDVYINGIKLSPLDYAANPSLGQVTILNPVLQAGDVVDLQTATTYVINSNTQYSKVTYTANAGQTTFATSYTPGAVNVYLNGLRLQNSVDYLAVNGTTIVISEALDANDVVEIERLSSGVILLENQHLVTRNTITVTANGDSVFVVGGGYRPGFVDVFLNGVKLNIPGDVTAINGNTITLLSPTLEVGDIIEVNGIGPDYSPANAISVSGGTVYGSLHVLNNVIVNNAVTTNTLSVTSIVNAGSLNVAIANISSNLQVSYNVTANAVNVATVYFNDGTFMSTAASGRGDGITWKIASANVTANLGEGLLVDTTSANVYVTLNASPYTGNTTRIVDMTSNFAINNCIIKGNGQKIMGSMDDLVISSNNAGIGLVYSNATHGWRLIENP